MHAATLFICHRAQQHLYISHEHAFLLNYYEMLAEPYLLLLQADGTLSGCTIAQRNLVNLWTVPGKQICCTQHTRNLSSMHIWHASFIVQLPQLLTNKISLGANSVIRGRRRSAALAMSAIMLPQ